MTACIPSILNSWKWITETYFLEARDSFSIYCDGKKLELAKSSSTNCYPAIGLVFQKLYTGLSSTRLPDTVCPTYTATYSQIRPKQPPWDQKKKKGTSIRRGAIMTVYYTLYICTCIVINNRGPHQLHKTGFESSCFRLTFPYHRLETVTVY